MLQTILDIYYRIKDPHYDGFYQFDLKKKLYEMKWLIDDILAQSPKFSGEEEWLEEMRKKKTKIST